jgi:3-oxoacid CoA-transferase subunit A
VVAEGKETRVIDGRPYVLEKPLRADFSLVKAYKADTWGNLTFRKTARNFNPVMCGASKVTIVEVEEIVPLGGIDPDAVHVPSIYVDRIVLGRNYEKPIERRTTRPR